MNEIQRAFERGQELMAGPRECEICGRPDRHVIYKGKRRTVVRVRVCLREGDAFKASNLALICTIDRPDPRPPRKKKPLAPHPNQFSLFGEAAHDFFEES